MNRFTKLQWDFLIKCLLDTSLFSESELISPKISKLGDWNILPFVYMVCTSSRSIRCIPKYRLDIILTSHIELFKRNKTNSKFTHHIHWNTSCLYASSRQTEIKISAVHCNETFLAHCRLTVKVFFTLLFFFLTHANLPLSSYVILYFFF